MGIRRISPDEYEALKSDKHKEKDRQTNLKLLFNLRPGVFDAEDQVEGA